MALPLDFDATRTRAEHIADHKALHRVYDRAAQVAAGGSIQAAIDAAQVVSTGNGTVRLGPGVWVNDVSPKVVHPEGLHIKGAGPFRTIIRPAADTDGLQVEAARYGHQFKLSDLSIEGGAAGLHILPGGETDLTLDRVFFTGQTTANVLTETGTYNVRATDCYFRSAPNGVKVTVFGHNWHFDSCRFQLSTDAAIDAFRARSWQFDNCLFENNAGHVARLRQVHTVTFRGGWLERNGIVDDVPMFVVTGDPPDGETDQRSWDVAFEHIFQSHSPTVFLDASAYAARVSFIRQQTGSCEVRLPGGHVLPYAPGEGRILNMVAAVDYCFGAEDTLWREGIGADGVETHVQVVTP